MRPSFGPMRPPIRGGVPGDSASVIFLPLQTRLRQKRFVQGLRPLLTGEHGRSRQGPLSVYSPQKRRELTGFYSEPPHSADHLDALDGVPAPLEEVVVDADPVHPEHLLPDRRQELLPQVARGHVRPTRPRRLQPGAGRARRSSLPLGVSGRASSTTNAAGTMYSGSRCGEVRAQGRLRRASAPGAGTT